MHNETRERLKDNYSAIYITIVSVMLGLALDDIVSTMRGIDDRNLFDWLTAAFGVHVIFNAWVGYSLAASIARLVPSIWDALNVFALSVGHFALNSAIGAEPGTFLFVAAGYSAVAGGVTAYNVWRANHDDAIEVQFRSFRAVLAINAGGTVLFVVAGVLAQTAMTTPVFQASIVALGIPFATLWIVAFLRAWRKAGLPTWSRAANA